MNLFEKTSQKQISIRLESIGGLGANLIGNLLGEMAVSFFHLNASSFASYGSEKRGSLVRSHIRICSKHEEIKENTPILNPDILVLFHPILLRNPQVLQGINEKTVLIVNASDEVVKDISVRSKKILSVDATSIALNTNGKINMVMLAAIFKALEIDKEFGKDLITETLGKKSPALLKGNLETFEAGYDKVKIQDGKLDGKVYSSNPQQLGYLNMPLGGVITEIGNMITHDLSASRNGLVPMLNYDKCIHCGLCDITCPDMVFQFELGEYKGLERMLNKGMDIAHCKGCMRCVQICPTKALIAVKENELDKRTIRKNRDCLIEDPILEYSGSNTWVSGESEFVEKNIYKENENGKTNTHI